MKLYKFPSQAKVDRLIPKNKFYEQGKANTKIEQLFVDLMWIRKFEQLL